MENLYKPAQRIHLEGKGWESVWPEVVLWSHPLGERAWGGQDWPWGSGFAASLGEDLPRPAPLQCPSPAWPPPAPRLLVGCTSPSASPRSCCSAPPALGPLSWPPFAHLSGSQQEVLVRRVLALTLERPRRCLASLGEGGTRCDRGSFPWGLGGPVGLRRVAVHGRPSACSGRALPETPAYQHFLLTRLVAQWH